jgi:hypothetical protein
MALSAITISPTREFYTVRTCGQIDNSLNGDRNATLSTYPDCASYYSGANPSQQAIVQANMSGNEAEVSAALGINFGAAGWLALAIHAIGIEIYVRSGLDLLYHTNQK